MQQIDNCPACNTTTATLYDPWEDDCENFVICNTCQARGPIARCREIAIEKWNDMPRLKDIQKLEEKLSDAKQYSMYLKESQGIRDMIKESGGIK